MVEDIDHQHGVYGVVIAWNMSAVEQLERNLARLALEHLKSRERQTRPPIHDSPREPSVSTTDVQHASLSRQQFRSVTRKHGGASRSDKLVMNPIRPVAQKAQWDAT